MSKYWEQRIMERQRIYDRAEDEAIARLYAAYNRASRQISEDIRVIFDQFRGMYDLTEAQAKELLSAPAPDEMLQMLKQRVDKMPPSARKTQLMARLSAPAYAARITRLEAVEESARVAMAQVAEKEIAIDTKAFESAAKTAYNRTMFDVQKASGLMFPVAGVSERRIQQVMRERWYGRNYSASVWRNTNATAKLTAQAVEEMLLSGKASRETFEDLMHGVIIKNGEEISPEKVMMQGKMAANRLLRTEYNHVTGQADMEAYEDAGCDKYRYMAVLDGRTSTICRDLDGKVFNVKDRKVGVNMHPMHPWCRSTTEPVFDDDALTKMERWARDPVTGEEMRVPPDMTYREWEKKMEELHGSSSELKRKIKEAQKKR